MIKVCGGLRNHNGVELLRYNDGMRYDGIRRDCSNILKRRKRWKDCNEADYRDQLDRMAIKLKLRFWEDWYQVFNEIMRSLMHV
jgi:hypothetical protein